MAPDISLASDYKIQKIHLNQLFVGCLYGSDIGPEAVIESVQTLESNHRPSEAIVAVRRNVAMRWAIQRLFTLQAPKSLHDEATVGRIG